MKYSVDRIENDIIVLENILNNEIVYLKSCDLPFKVKESDILVYKNNSYVLDNDEKNKRLRRIKEKMEKLKRND